MPRRKRCEIPGPEGKATPQQTATASPRTARKLQTTVKTFPPNSGRTRQRLTNKATGDPKTNTPGRQRLAIRSVPPRGPALRGGKPPPVLYGTLGRKNSAW